MKKEGFPQKIRVKKESEFQSIIRGGSKSHSDHLILFRLKRENRTGQRFGIKVNRGFKGAVQRNAVKRAAKEVLRKNKHRFDEDESVVVILKPTAGQIPSEQLREELENLIR
jgi:ribonuclease P protein component